MPSIIDQIAKELGISNATVSRALNDRPGVGAETREKILERARELKYTPGIMARGLATSQTFTVGFFVREKPSLPAHNDPFYTEILHGVEQICARSDYHVTIATLTGEILAKPAEFRFTRERRIDAMILAGPDIPNDFIMSMLQTNLPVVIVDNRLDHSQVDTVNCDDEKGAFMAAQHLISLGHQHIGVLSGPKHWASNTRRVRGYRNAILEADLLFQVVHMDRTTIESGEEAYRQIIRQHPHLTALCAVNDSMAIGAIRAARADKKSIPDDLSIVGFDDIAWASLNDPPLTTIRIPKQQMGKEAANRILARLNDPELLPAEIIVAIQFVQRQTTCPV